MNETDSGDAAQLLALADLVSPMAVRVAATINLADHVHGGCDTVPLLAEATGTHPRPMRKLVLHLVDLAILDRWSEQRFALTNLGRLLLSTDTAMVRATLDSEHILGRMEHGVVGLLHTMRTGEPAYDGTYGKDMWDDLNSNDGLIDQVDHFSKLGPVFDANLITDDYDWSDARHVVDVGGCSGALLVQLLQRQSHLHATLVDLPRFTHLAGKRMIESGLQHRCRVIARNFFEPLPADACVYLLSSILTDWDDAEAVRLLANCRRAAGGDGRVLVSEVHLSGMDIDPSNPSRAALRLEASINNPDRTPADIKALASQAGLQATWESVEGYRSLCELRPMAKLSH